MRQLVFVTKSRSMLAQEYCPGEQLVRLRSYLVGHLRFGAFGLLACGVDGCEQERLCSDKD